MGDAMDMAKTDKAWEELYITSSIVMRAWEIELASSGLTLASTSPEEYQADQGVVDQEGTGGHPGSTRAKGLDGHHPNPFRARNGHAAFDIRSAIRCLLRPSG
jgi:hypothetical protein